ncbi:MAG: hypothetical protein MR425_03355, partial [Lachnospiraceae bacterium]|nr:hypothetical protein [Lachnospiraceae bacterium]
MKLNKVKAVLIGMAGVAALGTMTTIEKKATEAVPASEEGTAVIADAGLVAGVSSITKDTLAEYEQAEIVKNDLEKTRAAADREEVQKDNEQENQEIEEQKIEEQ